jgi:hypothetical protein
MTFQEAQAELRRVYGDGAPGVLASGLVWLAATIVAFTGTPRAAMLTLFFGGMLIHPLGLLLCKAGGWSAQHTKGNPLAALAMESTVLMLLCIPLAFVAARVNAAWFFPAMLLIIGGRYLLFSTLYGNRIYWLLGGLLAAAGFGLVALQAPLACGAGAGALVELGFGGWLLVRARRAAR